MLAQDGLLRLLNHLLHLSIDRAAAQWAHRSPKIYINASLIESEPCLKAWVELSEHVLLPLEEHLLLRSQTFLGDNKGLFWFLSSFFRRILVCKLLKKGDRILSQTIVELEVRLAQRSALVIRSCSLAWRRRPFEHESRLLVHVCRPVLSNEFKGRGVLLQRRVDSLVRLVHVLKQVAVGVVGCLGVKLVMEELLLSEDVSSVRQTLEMRSQADMSGIVYDCSQPADGLIVVW